MSETTSQEFTFVPPDPVNAEVLAARSILQIWVVSGSSTTKKSVKATPDKTLGDLLTTLLERDSLQFGALRIQDLHNSKLSPTLKVTFCFSSSQSKTTEIPGNVVVVFDLLNMQSGTPFGLSQMPN